MRIFLFLSLLLTSCKLELFSDSSPIVLKSFDLGNEKNITIRKSISNATVEESIQIWTSTDSLFAKRIFKRYDILIKSDIIDEQLYLILKDTSGSITNIDTFEIEIEELFENR